MRGFWTVGALDSTGTCTVHVSGSVQNVCPDRDVRPCVLPREMTVLPFNPGACRARYLSYIFLQFRDNISLP